MGLERNEPPFLDSFDHLATNEMQLKYNRIPNNGGNYTIVAGRNGNGGQFGTFGPNHAFDSYYSAMCVGIAIKQTVLGFTIYCKGQGNPFEYLLSFSTGRLQIAANQGFTTYVASPLSSYIHPLGSWYYVEFKWSIAGKVLTYEAWINGTLQVLGGSGTSSVNLSTCDGFRLVGPGGGNSVVVDDLYVTTGTRLGDVNIGVIRPNGNGDSSQWTPNPAIGNNWGNIDDTTPDGDTTVNTAATSGLLDLQHYEDIGSFPIKAVQFNSIMRKSDAGDAEVNGKIKSAGVTVTFDTHHPSEASYFDDRHGYLVSPFTGVAFTAAEINAMQLGQERTL